MEDNPAVVSVTATGVQVNDLKVSDALWDRIRPLLPVAQRRRRWPGRKRMDDRACLNGILFVLATGIGWERLPQQLGYGSGMTLPAPVGFARAGTGNPRRVADQLPDLPISGREAVHTARVQTKVLERRGPNVNVGAARSRYQPRYGAKEQPCSARGRSTSTTRAACG